MELQIFMMTQKIQSNKFRFQSRRPRILFLRIQVTSECPHLGEDGRVHSCSQLILTSRKERTVKRKVTSL